MIEHGLLRRVRKALLACSAAFAGVLAPGLSRAHHALPAAREILFEPGNPSHIVVNSTAWGLFDSRDGGRSWSLYCTELMGGQSTHPQDVSVALAAGGRIVVSPGPFSGPFISDDGCTWRNLKKAVDSGLDGSPYAIAYEIAPADTTGREFLGLSVHVVDGGIESHLMFSQDRGDTWSRLGADFPSDLAIHSIAIESGQGGRRGDAKPNRPILYAGALHIDTGTPFLLSSHDGGLTWQRRPIPAANPMFDSVELIAIHSADPETVLLRMASVYAPTQDTPDRLFATRDGGRTWMSPYVPTGSMPGFAISPDGSLALIAGPQDGLLAAPLGNGFDGPFRRIFDGRVWGLTTSQGKLYAGLDAFTPDPSTASLVGVSSDDGAHFSRVMSVCDLTYPSCAANSDAAVQCSGDARQIVQSFLESCNVAPPPQQTGGAPSSNGGAPNASSSGGAGGARMEEGTPDGSPGYGGNGDDVRSRTRITKANCGCSTVASAVSSWPSLAAALYALAVVLRRREARRG
jgi:hypothetical protein